MGTLEVQAFRRELRLRGEKVVLQSVAYFRVFETLAAVPTIEGPVLAQPEMEN